MKNYFFLALCLILKHAAWSQDQLFTKDNAKTLVKITEISPDEIRYKLFSNLNGPVYVVNKADVSLIIYENGQHEVINSEARIAGATGSAPVRRPPGVMSKADSMVFYKYSSSVSMNFLSFLNTEIGVIYQKDFLKNNFNITIPLAVGLETPSVTESIYFNGVNSSLNLNRKLFEAGFGIQYYPSLKYPVNYYVGPTFRYMQYDCEQSLTYWAAGNPGQTKVVTKSSILSRYCMSITNGLIFRTRSRLIINMFGSIGFKSDQLSNTLKDPRTGNTVQTLRSPFNLYFWTGLMVGFCF